MRFNPSAGGLPARLVALAGLLLAGSAAAATLTCGTANGIGGQTVTVAIASTDLTGLGVTSYEFKVSYNANLVTALGAGTSGTLTGAAGWGSPTVAVTPGQIAVSAAGSGAIAGAGTLLTLSFVINPAQLTAGSTVLTMSNALLDEGVPPVTTANGSITIGATPVISVSPASGEIVRGATLQFTATGSVTQPVSWSTTDAGVATIGGSGLLLGVAPGTVRVIAVDAASHRDTTNGDILVRGMAVTVGSTTASLGETVHVPVTTTSLTGLGVGAGEIKVSFDNTRLAFVSASAPPGTLLHGYGSLSAGTSVNGSTTTVTLIIGGVDLAGAGTLFDLDLTADSARSGTAFLTLVSALFNENMPALLASGTVSVLAASSFTVLPATATLMTGQQQQFTLGGSPVPPVTWSTLDPTVATIDAAGRLTAIAGGVTCVRAEDATLGTALNTSVSVFDFALSVASVTGAPGQTVRVALLPDRDLTPLAIVSAEMDVAWPATWVTAVNPGASGAINAWGRPTVLLAPGSARIIAAGGAPLSGASVPLSSVDLTLSVATPTPSEIPVSVATTLFNEGRPLALVTNGSVHVLATTDAPEESGADFALAPAVPNPARGAARLEFTLPASEPGGAQARLTILGVDGRAIRSLCDGRFAPGRHAESWDLLDADGRRVPAGIYLARLEAMGRTLERKLAVIR